MLNRSGIRKETAGAPVQILGATSPYYAIGIIVDDSAGTVIGSRKIVKAGTPLVVDPANLQTPATKIASNEAIKTAKVILLHDVDVTDGDANGSGLVMGIVNYNRLESDVQALFKPGNSVSGVFCIAL